MFNRARTKDMKLRELLKGVKTSQIVGSLDVDIQGVSYNSKEVGDGFLFVALPGTRTDGHRFIEDAVKKGARALLVERIPQSAFEGVSIVRVDDTKSALALVSANFFSDPSKELTVVGVTGTNGKTTVTYLLEAIWKAEGREVGVIGTVEYRFSGRSIPSNMTTPESVDLMRLLREMKENGVSCVAMEVSSHALDKKRVDGCQFDAAVFTNITQDHLDYHGSMENYFNAKKRLFKEVLSYSEKKEKFSVVNFDTPYGRKIAEESAGEVISYSTSGNGAIVCVKKKKLTGQGIWAILSTPWGELEISSSLIGEHNLSNILAASATALSLGTSPEAVKRGISSVSSIPGRLEKVENPLGITVLVDYAHTPDALRNVLKTLRSVISGRLILVFGCGGDRDPIKRPIMGKIGIEFSDILIITSDNPRTESPDSIIEQIERGVLECEGKKGIYFKIPDRRMAIRKAVEIARNGDTVLVAGKGHENYQIVGSEKIPFDDRVEARRALEEKRRNTRETC